MWRVAEARRATGLHRSTAMTSTMTPRPSPYPDSDYLVAQPLPWNDGRRAAIILMATDGSERSDGALRIAAARADATGATLELMTVIEAEHVLAADNMYFGEAATASSRSAYSMGIRRIPSRASQSSGVRR
jgi:hypothetical protein